VTSALTLLEVLVALYRAGDGVLAEHYEALLTRSRGRQMLTWHPISCALRRSHVRSPASKHLMHCRSKQHSVAAVKPLLEPV
jgi:hypothetical protein